MDEVNGRLIGSHGYCAQVSYEHYTYWLPLWQWDLTLQDLSIRWCPSRRSEACQTAIVWLYAGHAPPPHHTHTLTQKSVNLYWLGWQCLTSLVGRWTWAETLGLGFVKKADTVFSVFASFLPNKFSIVGCSLYGLQCYTHFISSFWQMIDSWLEFVRDSVSYCF